MGNVYLEKVASILKPPARTMGSVIRSAKNLSGGKPFGFKSMAKTPLLQRIKESTN